MNDTRLLTAAELAERWRCSAGWLANQRCAGDGPGFLKLGALVRYPLTAIEEFEARSFVAQGAA